MRSLRTADYRKALDFIAALGDVRDLDTYATRLVPGLRRVIGCTAAGYNEVNLRRRRVFWVTDVNTTPAEIEAFEAHIHANPIVNFVAQHPELGATAVSDLLGEGAWRATGVYRDFYGPLGLEDVMAVTPSSNETVIGISVFRDRGRFSQHDHDMLTLLKPHLTHIYRNAGLMGDLKASIALLESGYDVAGLGAVTLDAQERILNMTARAQALLTAYFAMRDGALPEAVRRWLKRAAMPAAASHAMPEMVPLTVTRGPARLILRCVRHGARTLLLLREWRQEPDPGRLRALGLSRRESQMLALAAAGKTDRQIADTLSLSSRTVSHTLARVYRKLGVANRAAAAARALATGEL